MHDSPQTRCALREEPSCGGDRRALPPSPRQGHPALRPLPAGTMTPRGPRWDRHGGRKGGGLNSHPRSQRYEKEQGTMNVWAATVRKTEAEQPQLRQPVSTDALTRPEGPQTLRNRASAGPSCYSVLLFPFQPAGFRGAACGPRPRARHPASSSAAPAQPGHPGPAGLTMPGRVHRRRAVCTPCTAQRRLPPQVKGGSGSHRLQSVPWAPPRHACLCTCPVLHTHSRSSGP